MRPYVILNAGMTLDGKIATCEGDSEISSEEDLRRVHRLRSEVDAIMVGANTALKDDPRLSVHRIKRKGRNPLRVVVDSRARIPLTARMFKEEGETVVAVSLRADKARVERLREKAEVMLCGSEKVNLRCLMRKLYDKGVRKLLLEGGGNLNWSMLKEGLVDEVRVAIAPCIVGGSRAVTLVEGEGFSKVSEGIKLELRRTRRLGRDLVLEYTVVREGEDGRD